MFAAPHGGHLTPSAIPERSEQTCGSDDFVTVKDLNTAELAEEIQSVFYERTGRYPHVVINRLHRNRLDANRDIDVAACGDSSAELAWNEFIDLHGHGHDIQRLELGYALTGETLRLSDDELDADPQYEQSSSFRTFSEESPLSFTDLLRGPTSLGTLFEDRDVRATPSQQDPAPAPSEPFFSGGYNTREHGCSDGGPICGVTNFDILVPSPAHGIDTLVADVASLVADGTITTGQGTSLTAKLEASERSLDREPVAATNTLDAFVHQVEALERSDLLGPDDADHLSTVAERVVQHIHTE